jgi:3-hydroxyisobutyrate dehydrogenase-like beta-hydroxyacid dehydrogenase
MTSNIRRVGIIGLGKMGLPMARHLRNGGFAVAACDVNAAARTQAAAAGNQGGGESRGGRRRKRFHHRRGRL